MQSDRISELERLSLLTQLVLKYYPTEISFVDALILAKELAKVIDELNYFGIDQKQLSVDFYQFFPEHWKQRTHFLKIVTELWPLILKEKNKLDVAPKKNQSLYFRGKYDCLQSNLSKYLSIRDIKNKISVLEADDKFQEIDFITDTVKNNPEKTISITIPDKNTYEFLTTRFLIENIDYTSYVESFNRYEEYTDDFTGALHEYFSNAKIPEEDFSKLEKELIEYLHYEKLPKKVSIILPSDLKFCFSDIIFISSLNEDSWRERYLGEYWLHRSVREKLKMIRKDSVEDNFYAAFNNQSEIFLTRSKRSSGISNLKSAILEKFEAKCALEKIQLCHLNPKQSFKQGITLNEYPDDFDFPTELNANGIELLMADPYAFYTREILNLKPENQSMMKDLSICFKALMIACFSDKNSIEKVLGHIKNLDFFFYQKCQNAVQWLIKQNLSDENSVYNAIGKRHFEKDVAIDIFSHADKLIISKNASTLVCFKIYDNDSLYDIIRGTKSSILTTALVSEKWGFGRAIPPIRDVQIWSLAPYGSDPLSIRNLEISGELVEGYEERLFEALREYSKNTNLFFEERDTKIDSYKHFERRSR